MSLLDKTVETFRLAIFPLPGTVFFPNTLLPLHIFEPRYREMTRAVLASSRELSVVLLKPGYEANYEGRPAFFGVAGAGVIVWDQKLPDGRYNFVLQGVDRVEVLEEVDVEKPYRTALVRRIADLYPSGGPAALGAEAETLRRMFVELLTKRPDAPPELVAMAEHAPSPGALADGVASVVVADASGKQALLE
ncbi:MAG: LON peptidase substrate-binding domain-containing protein, partial [Candidatus Methylomirabilis sp.]|nr:LON peptidase substrate-binding domain-containing protein [Deltaproteobacteria bacterium]